MSDRERIIIEGPDDDKKDEAASAAETPPMSDEPQVFRITDEDFGLHFDRAGRITPLSDSEQAALAHITDSMFADAKAELDKASDPETEIDIRIFPAYEDFMQRTEDLEQLVKEMSIIPKGDEHRQEDDEGLEELAKELKEKFVVVIGDMMAFSTDRAQFMAFATRLLYDDLSKRTQAFQEIFDEDEEAFPGISLKKMTKKVAKRVAESDSDKANPDHLGDFYTFLLEQDINMARRLMKNIYRDHDFGDIKSCLLRVCELLEEINDSISKKTQKQPHRGKGTR